jgi:uncharacterized OsmC-like protein
MAAKRWSVSTLSSGDQPLQMFCDGKPLVTAAPGIIEGVSPVEHLLIAVATCFALSCRGAFVARQMRWPAFEVKVTGVKALDLPSRLESVGIEVFFGNDVSSDDAQSLAAAAKKLCTVTNTFAGAPVLINITTGVGASSPS